MSAAPHYISLYLALESELDLDLDSALKSLPRYFQEKALRKRSRALRESTIKAHSLMDWVLRRHYFPNGETYALEEESRGKPFAVYGKYKYTGFNLSHSAGYLAAVCGEPHRPVGVDCEAHHRVHFRRLAERFFSTQEQQGIRSADQDDQGSNAFLQTWTRKEAWVKMHGLGLQKPLDTFTVKTNPALGPAESWILEDADAPNLAQYATFSTRFPDGIPVSVASSSPQTLSKLEIFRVRTTSGHFECESLGKAG
ncbi:MAG: 4'-phosphopantetheinyl transferase superfamily protein [Verrucomicrobiota bacterium]